MNNSNESLIIGVTSPKFPMMQQILGLSCGVLISSLLNVSRNFAPDSLNESFDILDSCIRAKENTSVSLNVSESRTLFDMLSIAICSNLSLLRYNVCSDSSDQTAFTAIESGYGDFDIQTVEGDVPTYVQIRIDAFHELHLHNRLLNLVLLAIAEGEELRFSYQYENPEQF